MFRRHVGTALLGADPALRCASWMEERPTAAPALAEERELEAAVSHRIPQTRVLWIPVDDGPTSQRTSIERNAVALPSNLDEPRLTLRRATWLGHHCQNERVDSRGLRFKV